MLAYLKNVSEASAGEIEIATGLVEPEVSIAANALRGSGWLLESGMLREGSIKQEKQSRPMTFCSLRIHYRQETRKQKT